MIDEDEELPDVLVSDHVLVKVNLTPVQMQNKIPLNMPLLISDNVELDNDFSVSEEERLAAEEFFGSLKSPILIKKGWKQMIDEDTEVDSLEEICAYGGPICESDYEPGINTTRCRWCPYNEKPYVNEAVIGSKS